MAMREAQNLLDLESHFREPPAASLKLKKRKPVVDIGGLVDSALEGEDMSLLKRRKK